MKKSTKDFLISLSPTLQRASKVSNQLISLYSDEELFRITIIDTFLAKLEGSNIDHLRKLYLEEIKKEL